MESFKSFVAIFLLLTIASCEEQHSDSIPSVAEIGYIEFSIGSSNVQQDNGRSSSINASLNEAQAIVLTIQKNPVGDTRYISEKIQIHRMNGEYFSQKLSLEPGEYRLAEFYLIDREDNVIYVAPQEGSQQAQNVTYPLPLAFSIVKDQITSVNTEIVSTDGLQPEDFGLVGFPFSEVETFGFLVNVSEKGQMDSLLTALLIVSSGSYSFRQVIDHVGNNNIVIKDGLPQYRLTISKPGYLSYDVTLNNNEIRKFSTDPLVVELVKEEQETVIDYDGNVYHTVTIGNQTWLSENLKSERYCDGTDIQTSKFQDSDSIGAIYGNLYQWEAATRGQAGKQIQGACPCDWHIPSKDEWYELAKFLGWANAGGKLKAEGLTYWDAPNEGATDEYGFGALPAVPSTNGELGYSASFASSTQDYNHDSSGNYVHVASLTAAHSILWLDNNTKKAQTSIRCIKD